MQLRLTCTGRRKPFKPAEREKTMTTLIILLALINMIHFTTVDELPDQRNHQLYITVDHGICLNDEGDGKVLTIDHEHDYISYKGTGAATGDQLITFCIMNPLNDYCDDIIYRADINLH